jgi:hypothetical protein
MGKIIKYIEEFSYYFTQIFNENLRRIITVKIIDNIIVYTFYILLVTTSLFASISLTGDICGHLGEKMVSSDFPFILTFSEHLFLYFLPVFILYGLLTYYQRGLRKFNDSFSKLDSQQFENSEVALHLSKKLFFTSVLSYITLKIIEILFFKFDEYKNSTKQLISIGVFYVLIIIVIMLHTHREGNRKEIK